MGHDPSRGARRAVVGPHGGFWGITPGVEVIDNEVLLFDCEGET